MALLGSLIAAGCSSDDDMPPAPKPEPRVFDTSVIHGTDGLIACAEIDKSGNRNNHLGFYESSEYFAKKAVDARSRGDTEEADRLRQEAEKARQECHATSDITFLSDGRVRMNYDGGLRINLSGFEVEIRNNRYEGITDRSEILRVLLSIVPERPGGPGFSQLKAYELTKVEDKYKPKGEISMEFNLKDEDYINTYLEITYKITPQSSSELLVDFDQVTIRGSASFYKLTTAGEKQG